MKRAMIVAALILLGLAVAKSFGAMDRNHRESNAFSWSDAAPGAGWIHVRNTNGAIRIEQSENDSVSVVASTSWRGSPEEVAFVVNRAGDEIYICALQGGGSENDCDADTYRNQNRSWLAQRIWRLRPVTVAFTVRVPPTARIDAETSNGRITAGAPLASLKANTRNGRIEATEPVQSIEASTRNGSVSAVIADGPLAGDVLLETRNGSVTVELPADLDAQLAYETRHGRIASDFPLGAADEERHDTRRSGMQTLGVGGPTVTLTTRNGSVRIKRRTLEMPELSDIPEPPEPPVAPVADDPVAPVK